MKLHTSHCHWRERLLCLQRLNEPEENKRISASPELHKLYSAIRRAEGKREIIDEQRLSQDIKKIDAMLAHIQNPAERKQAVEKLKQGLKTIYQEFRDNDAALTERLQQVEKRVQTMLAPYLAPARTAWLRSLEGLTHLDLQGNVATFQFNGEPVQFTFGQPVTLSLPKQRLRVSFGPRVDVLKLDRILTNLQAARQLIRRHHRQPVSELECTSLEHFSFQSDEERYVVTPYAFLRVDSTWSGELRRQIDDLRKERDKLRKQIDSFTGGRDLRGRTMAWRRLELERLLQRHFPYSIYVVPGQLEKLEKAGEVSADEAKAIREFRSQITLSENRRMRRMYSDLSEVETRLAETERRLKTGRRLIGWDADSQPVRVIQPSADLEWQFFNEAGRTIRARKYSTGVISTETEEELYSSQTDYHASGGQTVTQYTIGTDERVRVDYYTKHGIHERTVRYDPDTQQVRSIFYPELGLEEQYKDGSLVETRITGEENADRALRHVSVIRKRADGWQLIRLAAQISPVYVFWRLNDLNTNCEDKEVHELIRIAINTMTPQQIREMLEAIQKRGRYATGKQRHEVIAQMKRRLEQLRIGDILVRSTEEFRNTPAFWEDPSLQRFFDVREEWIDWNSPALRALFRSADKRDHEFIRLQIRVIMTRNLHFQGIPPEGTPLTQNHVKAEMKRWLEARERLRKRALFRQRNILFVAHEDHIEDAVADPHGFSRTSLVEQLRRSGDGHIFGRAALIKELREQQGSDREFTFVRPERGQCRISHFLDALKDIDDLPTEHRAAIEKAIDRLGRRRDQRITRTEMRRLLLRTDIPEQYWPFIIAAVHLPAKEHQAALRKRKQEVLHRVRNMPPPFTFVFDGHGGRDALYLSHGHLSNGRVIEKKDTIKITSQELADAFRARQEQFADWYSRHPDDQDIFIIAACFNANFMHAVYDRLGDGTKPIIVGQSEFEQPSVFHAADPHGSSFLSRVTGAGSRTIATLGTVMDNELLYYSDVDGSTKTNPTLLAPDRKNRRQQITKNQAQNRDASVENA